MANSQDGGSDRKDEILDVAGRLFGERGYGDTSIQSIINAIGIAKGTFYHHFPSKDAVLDALVERVIGRSVAMIRPAVEAPDLNAVERLNRYFETIAQWKVRQKPLMMALGQALLSSTNVQMWNRLIQASAAAHSPLIAKVIRQGNQEGLFDVPQPEMVALMVFNLSATLGQSFQRFMTLGRPLTDAEQTEAVTMIDAYHLCVERMLCAPPGSLVIFDKTIMIEWFDGIHSARPKRG